MKTLKQNFLDLTISVVAPAFWVVKMVVCLLWWVIEVFARVRTLLGKQRARALIQRCKSEGGGKYQGRFFTEICSL